MIVFRFCLSFRYNADISETENRILVLWRHIVCIGISRYNGISLLNYFDIKYVNGKFRKQLSVTYVSFS